eukprot:GEZU01015307.1.p2 GENE.GEZU01015307.1~~GEZU01015307.1.p2  ORF type:complete len:107 (-),score=5.08 GEZU01015307.1:92-412(-)
MNGDVGWLLDDEFVDRPVFEAAIRQVSPYNNWYFSLIQFLLRNKQWIRKTLEVNHRWSVHAQLQRARTQYSRFFVFCHEWCGYFILFGFGSSSLWKDFNVVFELLF